MPWPDSAVNSSTKPPLPPTQTRLSVRPLRTLAIKPALQRRPLLRSSTTLSTLRMVYSPRTSFICPVCRKPNCQLPSHKAFAKRRLSGRSSPVRTSASPAQADFTSNYTKSYAYNLARLSVDRSLATSAVDPFIKLPIPNNSSPEFHRLFWQCASPLLPPQLTDYR
jgi:hypothetical protein